MAGTRTSTSPALTDPYPHLRASPRLHFSLLTHAEKASFEAGLRTRIWNRVLDAVTKPTQQGYQAARAEHAQQYFHLVEVRRAETSHASEPVTDEHLTQMLEQVEDDLGDSWRHKLEHAINMSHASLRIMARVNESGVESHATSDQAMVWVGRWVSRWMVLNWSIDCIIASTGSSVVAVPEVVQAIFDDLKRAAEDIYSIACDVHDDLLGDPDEE